MSKTEKTQRQNDALARLKELQESGFISEGQTLYTFYKGKSERGVSRYKVYTFPNNYPLDLTFLLAELVQTGITYWKKSETASMYSPHNAIGAMSMALFGKPDALKVQWWKL